MEELIQELDYDPTTGDLIWKSGQRKGKIAGCLNDAGYRKIRYKRQVYPAHRVVWFMHHGELPEIVDHINRDRADNRLENLRPATAALSSANRRTRKGYLRKKGETACSVYVQVEGTKRYIGGTPCPLLARIMYLDAKAEIYGVHEPV